MHTKLQVINHIEWDSLSSKPKITIGVHPSPWGNCVISQTGRALCGFSFQDIGCSEAVYAAGLLWPGSQVSYNEEATAHWISIARDYLEGGARGEEYSLFLLGTAFQITVWRALLEIETTKVVSYRDIANKIGCPKAVRAVGTAIGKNKISILIPCHRVVRSSGGLGGYAWGLSLKQSLLDYEVQFRRS